MKQADLLVVRGDTRRLRVRVTCNDGAPYPGLSSCTARAQVRPFISSSTVLDTLSTENGRIRIDVDDSALVLDFPASVTRGYTFYHACFDLELTHSNGDVDTPVRIRLTVLQDGTR